MEICLSWLPHLTALTAHLGIYHGGDCHVINYKTSLQCLVWLASCLTPRVWTVLSPLSRLARSPRLCRAADLADCWGRIQRIQRIQLGEWGAAAGARVGLRGQDRCRPRGGGCVITAVIISDGGSDKWDKMSPGNRLATVAMTAVVVIALNSLLVISFTGWLAVVLECPQSPGGPSTPSLSVSHTLSHCSRHRVCTARSEKSVAV